MSQATIQHHPQDQEFTAELNGATAELAYSRPDDQTIDFAHTFVDEALRGQGVGEQLARHALAFARDEKLRVLTSCRFMQVFVKKHHAEYADLLA
ncbi:MULTISPECIES: GNAT family N-acetyltransferase [Hymenobacter]|uniref:N-acetyltransferase n=1 Tax=Hymenobacter guriensis TaxID=2793065 RepID=A0ABS0L6Y2_9BACT|nr:MULTISPECIES: GNAT family N-acetyltransferase [Hymenobacter]MBG8555877.1 N-acetyltransferase [Hymenobacter guriensis]MCR5889441.1 N-acetyltransferase [Hymenobacter sp. J193]